MGVGTSGTRRHLREGVRHPQQGHLHQRGDPHLRQQEIHTDANKTSSHRREGSQHFKGTRCKGTIHYCLFFLHLLKECSPIQDSSELDTTLRKDCESRLSKLETHMQVVMLTSGDVLCSLFFLITGLQRVSARSRKSGGLSPLYTAHPQVIELVERS